jgi:hypothetical protein
MGRVASAETLECMKLVQQFHSFYRPLPPLPPMQVRIVVSGRRTTDVLPGDAAQ